ncbi:Bifunctional protein FolD, partial [Gonioctena quinquepunctata]
IDSGTFKLSDTLTQDDLLKKIKELNEDSSVNGMLVQLPFPKLICERTVCNAVDPGKDVDGFHITTMG